MSRDWIHIAAEKPEATLGRCLNVTPWQVGVIVANERIEFGQILSELHGGYIMHNLKRVIFRAVRDAIVDNSRPPHEPAV